MLALSLKFVKVCVTEVEESADVIIGLTLPAIIVLPFEAIQGFMIVTDNAVSVI